MGSSLEESHRPLRFLTIEQVAQELNVGEPLVRGMLKSGELRGIQLGGRGVWRIGRGDVEEYVEQASRGRPKISGGGFFDQSELPAD